MEKYTQKLRPKMRHEECSSAIYSLFVIDDPIAAAAAPKSKSFGWTYFRSRRRRLSVPR